MTEGLRSSLRPWTQGLGLLIAFSLTVTAAHGSGAEEAKPKQRQLQGAILVIIDTARADHLSVYGHGRDTSPTLQALAKRGVLFEQVVSYSPWTLPSVATILSGDRFTRAYDIDKGKLRRSLVEEIQRAGYATGAVTEGGFVSAHFGFELGFDLFREERGAVFLKPEGEEPQESGTGGVEETFALAARWLRRHANDRFFLLIHTYEPHTPYSRSVFTKNIPRGSLQQGLGALMIARIRSGEVQIGEKERRYASALYDGGLRVVDNQLEALFRLLKQLELADRTLIVVTSDHGEELGDHHPRHLADHGHALFDDQLLVPLIIADPTRSYPRARVATQVRSIDILPTVADLLGANVAGPIEGRSLVPVMRGEESDDRIAFGGVTKLTPPRYFIRDGRYKYIESSPREGEQEVSPVPPLVQLYDLRADPGEQHNLSGQDEQRVKRFHQQLVEYLDLEQQPISIESATEDADADLREQLRALGYVK